MKNIAILGSTGSVGVQALDLISRFPERFELVALAAGSNFERLAAQAQQFRPRLVALANPEHFRELKSLCDSLGVEAAAGEEGLLRAATHPDAQRVVAAIVGAAGLPPVLAAIRARILVAHGRIVEARPHAPERRPAPPGARLPADPAAAPSHPASSPGSGQPQPPHPERPPG